MKHSIDAYIERWHTESHRLPKMYRACTRDQARLKADDRCMTTCSRPVVSIMHHLDMTHVVRGQGGEQRSHALRIAGSLNGARNAAQIVKKQIKEEINTLHSL